MQHPQLVANAFGNIRPEDARIDEERSFYVL